MPAPSHAHRPVRSILRRAASVAATLVAAAAIAGGCGAGDVDAPAELDGDAMRWLPADTWLVATGDVSAARIDEAIDTLDRLPIWALVESELPAGDGVDLRRELLQSLAEQADADLTGDQLEQAFGNRVGFAIFDNDLAALDGDDAPFAAWVHVDDEQLAREAAQVLFDGDDDEREHAGVTYFESAEDEATWAVRDELLLVTTTPERMEQLIDVREDEGEGGSLADDELGAAVIDAGIGDAVVGVAIATDPVLAAVPPLVREAADEELADDVERALATDGVDDLVPDWMAASMTIDDVGLRMRAAWSNPRPLAEPDPSSRELLERMPADAPIASTVVADGSMLERVQAAWADVVEATDLDLRRQADCESRGRDAWACALLVEAALTMLEDEDLAAAAREQGDTVTAIVQDPTATITGALHMGRTGGPAPRPTARTYDLATSALTTSAWQPSDELARAMRDAGLRLTITDGGGAVVKVVPTSPLGAVLRRELDAEARQALAALGLDVGRLLSSTGLRLQPQQVDGLSVLGVPTGAPSQVAAALAGDVDVLGDLTEYRDVVDAVDPPEQVGSYAWMNVRLLVEGIVEAASTQSPQLRRALPSIRNNLSDVPGMLSWTSRTQVDGIEVGVAESVLPVLD